MILLIETSSSNSRYHLQRVAFKLSTGDSFYFRINPNSMQESFGARNVFLQPEDGIQMQGFGAGLHTITIAGTTGVRSFANGTYTYDAGFQDYQKMYSLLSEQLSSSHDNTQDMSTTTSHKTSTGVNLDYYDYTNEHYFHCELSPDGFQFTQSSDNPLSYFYSINLVVIGTADEPTYSQTTWVVLGNVNTGLSKTKLADDSGEVISNKYTKDIKTATSRIDAALSDGKYKDYSGSNFSSLINDIKSIESNMDSRGVDGYRSPIVNYNDRGSKIYSFGKSLSKSKIESLYSKVYTGLTAQVHIVVGKSNIMDINISSDNKSAWDSYWELYTNTAMKLSKKSSSGINDYGQTDADDSSSSLPNYNFNNIDNTLYGNTVPKIDLSGYKDTDAIYKQLFGSVLSSFSESDYKKAVQAFSGSIESTILNYGQVDAGDTSKILGPYSVKAIYNDLYANTVSNFDYSKYLSMGQLYIAMNGGDMSNFTADEGPDEVNASSANALPDSETAQGMYNILFGDSLDEDDYTSFLNTVDAYNNLSDYEDSITEGQSSVNVSDDGVEYVTDNDDFDLDALNNKLTLSQYEKQISDSGEDSTTDTWTEATQSSDNSGTTLFPVIGDDYSDSYKSLSNSDDYLNPIVSADAPLYGYNEISNILKV